MRADFSSQNYFRNPAAEIERLRSAGPVVEVRFPIVGKVWTTTTQDLADRVLKDSDTFTLRRDDGSVAGLQWWMPGVLRMLANNMLSMDEPDHRRLRDIVDEAFRRRARRGAVQRGQSSRPRRPLCAQAPAFGDLRASRPAPCRQAKVYRLGKRLHALHGRHRLPEHDPECLRDEALHGKAVGNRTRERRRGSDRRAGTR